MSEEHDTTPARGAAEPPDRSNLDPMAPGGPGPTGTAEPERAPGRPESVAEIRADRDEARAQLGDTMEQLAGKADVSSRAGRAARQAAGRVRRVGAAARGQARWVGVAVGGASAVAGGVVLARRRLAKKRVRARQCWWSR